ncbi:hypothetical protein AB3466_10455 [Sphingobacterium thalpophilum]|uniref:hypothetical protein n=1 Tax=Sphingobacterium TaxID=28453 RepID=UPI002243823B|nr:hypothetical protein [Sphingobacterium sp. InxBP1]MCW8311853.1 hypothetical protein [Sphingobacterium sp. InxBP1]
MTKIYRTADRMMENRLDPKKRIRCTVQSSDGLKTSCADLRPFFPDKDQTDFEVVKIRNNVEKAKELLVYTGHSTVQIAKALGYNKATELSKLLLNYTGLPSGHFRRIRKAKLAMINRQQKQ